MWVAAGLGYIYVGMKWPLNSMYAVPASYVFWKIFMRPSGPDMLSVCRTSAAENAVFIIPPPINPRLFSPRYNGSKLSGKVRPHFMLGGSFRSFHGTANVKIR